MLAILAFLIAVALGGQTATPPPAAAGRGGLLRCYISQFRGAATPQGADATMIAVSDGQGGCGMMNYGLADARQNPATAIKLTLVPAHGRAIPSAPRVIYNPQQGYVGPDAFAYEATAVNGAGEVITLRVRVAVDVRAEMFARAVEPGPARVGRDVGPPQKIKDVRPNYPADAMRAGVQGMVMIEATIGPDGKVVNTTVMRSIPMLDAAAIEAVRQWEFTPSVVNGQPVPVVMTVTVNFAQQPGSGPPPVPARPPAASRGSSPTSATVAPRAATPPPPIEDTAAIARLLERNHDLDFDKGRQLAQRQEFMEALKEYRKANDGGNGRCAECYLAMAQAYEGLGASKNVVDSCNRAIELGADNTALVVQARQMKGRALQTLAAIKDVRKLQEAESEYRQALALDPDAAYLHFGLGVVLMQQRRDAEGAVEMRAELAVRPGGARSELASSLIADPRRARESFAPEFSGVTLDRELVTLTDLRGKVVLLDFWGTWCPPCVSAVSWLRDLQRHHAKDPFVIVGISSDNDEVLLREFTGRNQMAWPQFWDKDRRAQQAYEIRSWPTYIVLDDQGIVRLRGTGNSLQAEVRIEDEIKRELKAVRAR